MVFTQDTVTLRRSIHHASRAHTAHAKHGGKGPDATVQQTNRAVLPVARECATAL